MLILNIQQLLLNTLLRKIHRPLSGSAGKGHRDDPLGYNRQSGITGALLYATLFGKCYLEMFWVVLSVFSLAFQYLDFCHFRRQVTFFSFCLPHSDMWGYFTCQTHACIPEAWIFPSCKCCLSSGAWFPSCFCPHWIHSIYCPSALSSTFTLLIFSTNSI